MSRKSECFVRGVLRLLKGAGIAVLVVLVCNAVGYQAQELGLTLITPDTWPESYLGRVLLLAFVGFLNIAAWLAAMAGAGLVLVMSYNGILYLGGYRETKLCADHQRSSPVSEYQ